MKTADFLRSVLESEAARPDPPKSVARIEFDAMVDYIKNDHLSEAEVSAVARALVERFLELNVEPNSFLPRVGHVVGSTANGEQVVVTKVETRQTGKREDYWVVGLDFGGRGTRSKMVYPRRDGQFKVSWQTGKSRWQFEVVDGTRLKNELTRNVFKL